MQADPHLELLAALKHYREALDRLSSAARAAAASGAARDAWPAAALRVWWQLSGLSVDGVRQALKAWRSWEGLSRGDAEQRLRDEGRLVDCPKGAWGRWERGDAEPDPAQRQDLEAVVGIPPSAWL